MLGSVRRVDLDQQVWTCGPTVHWSVWIWMGLWSQMMVSYLPSAKGSWRSGEMIIFCLRLLYSSSRSEIFCGRCSAKGSYCSRRETDRQYILNIFRTSCYTLVVKKIANRNISHVLSNTGWWVKTNQKKSTLNYNNVNVNIIRSLGRGVHDRYNSIESFVKASWISSASEARWSL